MTIKYLKSTAGSGAINLDTINGLVANVSTFFRAITIANSTVTSGTTTGALVVQGGVGIAGSLSLGGSAVVNGTLRAFSANFTTNATIAGTLTSTNINNSGLITSSSGSIGILNSTTVTATGLGTFGSLQVNNLANVGQLSAISGTVTNLSSTGISTVSLSASGTVDASTLAVDGVQPRTGLQINFGNADKVRITGGTNGQVLGTDGNGNLTWVDGPGALNVGTGLTRVGNTISLAGTGFAPGVYNTVTVDIYGRVVNGSSVVETLDTVATRGATTGQIISLTNSTDSNSVASGALIVTGGLGVAKTITANKVVSKTSITAEQALYAQDIAQFSKTAFFNGTDNSTVPIKIKAGSLIPGASSGSIEFDGDYLYITTSAGRQILAARDVNAPSSPVAAVKAVATRNINISAATQTVVSGIDIVDCWDDVLLTAFDRVLLTQQTNPAENGVWVFAGEGQPLQRALDFNALTGIFNGTIIFVSKGTLNAGSYYKIDSDNPIAVGTDSIDIVQLYNKNNISIADLPKDTTAGFVTRTEYGVSALRSLVSTSAWVTVANADGKSGNPTISTGIVPVTSGGTGRTNIIGWMRGTGTSIVSSQTIPLANIAGAGTMASQNSNNVSITGGNVSVNDVTANTVSAISNLTAGNAAVSGTTTTTTLTATSATIANLTVSGPINVPGLYGNAVSLGTNTTGSLSTAAVTVSTSQSVTDALALMNVVLGKLVPPPPPNFPNSQTLSISSLSTARMADFTQTDNTATQGRSVPGGTTIAAIRRSNSYQTNNITGSGPGDTGTVTVYKNGTASGSKTMVAAENGTYGDLVIFNNQDYSIVNPAVAANFWYSFDTRAAGTVSAGWNEVNIAHTASTATNTAIWYYDASNPGTPQFTNTMITEDVAVLSYSSTVPHYTSNSRFDISFDINRLSGDTYPTTDNFATGTSAGAFATPVTLSYSAAGIATPLTRNLYATSGSVNVTTTANIRSGFGSSSLGPSLSVDNSYSTGSHTFTPSVIVLYKTGTTTQIEETSIPVNSVGSGSGNGYRIVNPGSSDTPVYSVNAVAFDSQTSTLNSYDATVVGAVLKHDQTDYSTGHLPIGPNLSAGRTGTQYFTFKFVRSVVSKFDIKYTGTIAGLYVALPGSTIDSSSTLNGWLDLGVAYNGSGIPGAGAGGNGSNGAAIGGIAPLNSAQTNKRVTATFGTASSSNTATNEIYVRVKLTAGQSLTALSIETASN